MAFQTVCVISSGVSHTQKSLEVCFQDFVPCDTQDDDSSACQRAHNSHLLIERRKEETKIERRKEETKFLGIPVYVWMGPCYHLWGLEQLDQASFAFLLCDIGGILVKISSVSCIPIIRHYCLYWIIRRHENITKCDCHEWLPGLIEVWCDWMLKIGKKCFIEWK